jgi:HEAT repeat protein
MYAAASLGQQRDSRAREALNAALNDEHQQVRFYARAALDQIRN